MDKLTEVVRSTKLIKIEGFSMTSAMSENAFLKSGVWNVDGYDWEIRIYPNIPMVSTSSRGVQLNLYFRSEARAGNGVKATLSYVIPNGNPYFEICQGKAVSQSFKRPGDCMYSVLCQTRTNLVSAGCVKDDSITIECTIKVLRELANMAATHHPADDLSPSSGLNHHLGELLRNGTGADVTLVVSGESFLAHKAILASRSPVFMAEFFGHMKEKHLQRVEIKDMEAAVLGALLHFIYTDMVPDLDQPEDGILIAQHLLVAADRYGLDRLKSMCEHKLCDSTTVETAATTLALAEQHGCSHLKARCVELIAANLEASMLTEGYKDLIVSCPSVLNDILKAVRGIKI